MSPSPPRISRAWYQVRTVQPMSLRPMDSAPLRPEYTSREFAHARSCHTKLVLPSEGDPPKHVSVTVTGWPACRSPAFRQEVEVELPPLAFAPGVGSDPCVTST